ncbi:MAG TPA: hypothetical protein VES64_05095 [Allosphingosinicella sp.]|nr:hypothetical protein [Allosphingosinicella sp.]
MRMILATASLVVLAACGGGASNNAAGNGAAPAEGANAAGPAPAAAANPQREREMRACDRDVRGELPAGTDINAFCNCAVDKMAQNGGNERPAMNECAAQMGIRPQGE